MTSTLRIDRDILKNLKSKCAKEDKSMKVVVEQLIEEYLKG